MNKTSEMPPVPVERWRYWARRIVERCGWKWSAIERNERISAQLRSGGEPEGPKQPVSGLGEAVYWAMAQADGYPAGIVDEAATTLESYLLPLAVAYKSPDGRTSERASGDFCNRCRDFPDTLRRIADERRNAAGTETPAENAPGTIQVQGNVIVQTSGAVEVKQTRRTVPPNMKVLHREAVEAFMKQDKGKPGTRFSTRFNNFKNWLKASGKDAERWVSCVNMTMEEFKKNWNAIYMQEYRRN